MPNSGKVIGIVILVLVVIFGLKYIHVPEASSQTVKLGVIAGTTGDYAAAGEGYMKGFNLALNEWNQTHDLKFNAVVEDDGFNAQKGVSAYLKLKSVDRVDVYAVLSSFTIDAIYDQLHQENKPVALGFEQTKLAERDNIFQVLPAAIPVETALGQKIKELGYKNPVAAVSNNTAVYQNFYSGFQSGYESNVKKFEMGDNAGDIKSQALAIVTVKPDVVAFFMAPQDGALLVKEILRLTANTSRPYFVFDQSIQSGGSDYKNILGSDISKIDGSLVAMSNNDYTPDFISKFKKQYGIDPVFGSDMGYNSFMLLANTYSSNPKNWINNMEAANFTGADGQLTFDSLGLRVPNIFFAKLKQGEIIK